MNRRIENGGEFGINLVGFASANLGLGVALRNTASILEAKGIPFCVIDVDLRDGRSGHDLSLQRRFHAGGGPPPFPVNLFHMNPPELMPMLRNSAAFFRLPQRMNVGVPFWELPLFPPSWIEALGTLDMVLAPSRYIQFALDTQLPKGPSRYYRQGLGAWPEPRPDRARWGLPGNRTVFLSSFDLMSDIDRKNPQAGVKAFLAAFPEEGDSHLLIKVNNAGAGNRPESPLGRMLQALRGKPHVQVLDKVLSYADVMSLYSSADVYVSLHRAEGLGLGLMESMALGKPVIATGWSGNADFTDDANSCLVGHRLVALPETSQYVGIMDGLKTVWADPSVDEAADWMGRLARDPDLRAAIGSAGQASVRKVFLEAREGRVFDGLRTLYEHRRAVGGRMAPKARGGGGKVTALLQNRTDSGALPGGDTVVLEETRNALESQGVPTRLSFELTPEVAPNEVVHLINITRARDTWHQMLNARRQGRPTVLFPLFEDLDRYLVRATKLAMTYSRLAETRNILPMEDIFRVISNFELPAHPLDNPSCRDLGIGDAGLQQAILSGVDHIITSGGVETGCLRERFRFEAPVTEMRFGVDPAFRRADGRAFESKYGLKDFALCVGRIEPRKNQWTLIEIFRNLPDKLLVLVGAVNPALNHQAIQAFAPKNVRFINRLPREDLVSAYAAARVHVLPSWYELPGLVSLEAAAAGSRVVSTSWGTARDYFGNRIRYCEPDNPGSIRSAVLEAFDSRLDPDLREFVLETCRWDLMASRLAGIYPSLAMGGRGESSAAGGAAAS